MMQINWNRFIVNLLPKALRTATAYGFIRALFAPVIDLFNRLRDYNEAVQYKLAHTSQVWSIQALLNDAFDPDLRRIRIDDAGGLEPIALGTDADGDQIIPLMDDTDPFALNSDSAYTGGLWNAVVVLPHALSESEMYRLRAVIDEYRLAGVRYDVIVINAAMPEIGDLL